MRHGKCLDSDNEELDNIAHLITRIHNLTKVKQIKIACCNAIPSPETFARGVSLHSYS